MQEALIGNECTTEEIVMMMQKMGWKFRRTNQYESVVDTTRLRYNNSLQFCHAGFSLLLLRTPCAGFANIYRLNEKIVWIAAAADI
jgi:hypothetical protein